MSYFRIELISYARVELISSMQEPRLRSAVSVCQRKKLGCPEKGWPCVRNSVSVEWVLFRGVTIVDLFDQSYINV